MIRFLNRVQQVNEELLEVQEMLQAHPNVVLSSEDVATFLSEVRSDLDCALLDDGKTFAERGEKYTIYVHYET
jgi:hypothetical protein